jgi:SAM-dependent methyltransferase
MLYSSFGGLNESLGQGLSLDARERDPLQFGPLSFTYGEITFQNIAHLFELIRNQTTPNVLHGCGGVFYDLGCGTGKPSFAAALLHDFDTVGGVEMVADLLNVTEEVTAQWAAMSEPGGPLEKSKTRFNFVQGDATIFSDLDWSVADMVFIHATCFSDEFIQEIAELVPKLREGSLLVSISRMFAPRPLFRLIADYDTDLDWGEATIYVHQRENRNLGEDASAGVDMLGSRELVGGRGADSAGWRPRPHLPTSSDPPLPAV